MATRADAHQDARTSRRSAAALASAAEEAKQERLRLLGKIIKASRGDTTQKELGDRLARIKGTETPQTTISRWELGMVDMSVEQIRDLEFVLDLPPGSILIAAGYVNLDSVDVRSLLRSDPLIHPDFRDDLVRFYDSYVDMSSRIIKERRRASSAR